MKIILSLALVALCASPSHAGLFSRGSHALVCILGYTMLLQTVAVYSGPH